MTAIYFNEKSDFKSLIANLLFGTYRPDQSIAVILLLAIIFCLNCLLDSTKTKFFEEYKAPQDKRICILVAKLSRLIVYSFYNIGNIFNPQSINGCFL